MCSLDEICIWWRGGLVGVEAGETATGQPTFQGTSHRHGKAGGGGAAWAPCARGVRVRLSIVFLVGTGTGRSELGGRALTSS